MKLWKLWIDWEPERRYVLYDSLTGEIWETDSLLVALDVFMEYASCDLRMAWALYCAEPDFELHGIRFTDIGRY